jgi:hypothetical protein
MRIDVLRSVGPPALALLILLGSGAFVAVHWNDPPPSCGGTSYGPPMACVPGSPYRYAFTDWQVPLCGPGSAGDFRGVNFSYYYVGCYADRAETLVVNGTETNGSTYSLAVSVGSAPDPAFVTLLSPDAAFGFEWTLESPQIRLLVAYEFTATVLGEPVAPMS